MLYVKFTAFANAVNIVVNSIVINSRRFMLREFTQDIAIHLGINANFENLADFRPDERPRSYDFESNTICTTCRVSTDDFSGVVYVII